MSSLIFSFVNLLSDFLAFTDAVNSMSSADAEETLCLNEQIAATSGIENSGGSISGVIASANESTASRQSFGNFK